MAPIMYNHEAGGFVVVPETCCGQPLVDTMCEAPGCAGFRCDVCGSGCDADTIDSQCVRAVLEESDEQYARRIRAERDAWGLPPIS